MTDAQKAPYSKWLFAFFADLILAGILTTGIYFVMSVVLRVDSYNDTYRTIISSYEREYGVTFGMTAEEYGKLSEEEKTNYKNAVDAANADEEANKAIRTSYTISFCIFASGIVLSVLILEFVIPIFTKDGRSLGKLLFGLGVMRGSCIRISKPVLFVRNVIGKGVFETALPAVINRSGPPRSTTLIRIQPDRTDPVINKSIGDDMRIILQNLTKCFPSRNKKSNEVVTAVKDLDIEIPDGKLIGLLGPSGCGKSTTLYMICGLQKPTSGKIFFGDSDVTNLEPEHRGVGLVFQNYALYPHLTVKQNILFPLQNLKGAEKLTKEQMLERAQQAADLVQIGELMDRKPNELSGGQQQRVAIARALVKTPRVLLLDEPLSNLDARLRLQTREEIKRIQRETNVTTVFVTHDQEEAMSISDMIVVMKDGVVQQTGEPQKVYDDPENLFVAQFLGTPPINTFDGQIKGGKLYIGEDEVLDVPAVTEDKPVAVGIRPEGFIPNENGKLSGKLINVEVMGRDCSVVFANACSRKPNVRAIIDADLRITTGGENEIRFDVKKNKVFIFDNETGARIRF